MRQLLEVVTTDPGTPVLARIIASHGSSPREVGAALVVDSTGRPHGGLTGGCIEAALLESAKEVVAQGFPRIERFGPSDDDPAAIGLACGGVVDVLVQPITDPAPFAAAADRARRGLDVVLITHLRTGYTDARPTAPTAVPEGCWVQMIAAPPRMILVGSNEFVRATAQAGSLLGFRVTVVDARPTFTTTERFPAADDVVVDWPHRYLRAAHADPAAGLDARAVVLVMSHDDKFDLPALEAALAIPDIFVGALGSRRTAADRCRRLSECVAPHNLSRLHSPVGLDLGGATPEETAISIVAEIVAARSGRNGGTLRSRSGPIH